MNVTTCGRLMILPFSAYLIKSAALLGRTRFSKSEEKSIIQEAEKEVRSSIKQSCTFLLECKLKVYLFLLCLVP